jgi:competence protein ComFC
LTAFWQELFFPSRLNCSICHQPLPRRNELKLCGRCLAQLNFVSEPFCQICGRPLRLALVDRGRCNLCRLHNFHFTKARAVAVYEGLWRECIHMMKYCHRGDLIAPMAGLMAQVFRQFWPEENLLLVPVPQAINRKARRGYDHAQLLALELGLLLKMPVETDNLWLKKATQQQSQVGKEARALNVRGAFAVHEPEVFSGKQLLLIDDLLTTGWTASECAKALLGCKATRVDVLTLAVGAIERSKDGFDQVIVRR